MSDFSLGIAQLFGIEWQLWQLAQFVPWWFYVLIVVIMILVVVGVFLNWPKD